MAKAKALEVPKEQVKILNKFIDCVPEGTDKIGDNKTNTTYDMDARQLSETRKALGKRHSAEGVKDAEKKQIKKMTEVIDKLLPEVAEDTAELLTLPENVVQHPFGAVIPPLSDDEFKGLCKSVKKNGYQDQFPIVVYEGMILDGWHRWQACLKEGVTPKMVKYSGKDPIGFVRSSLERRHMSDDMKASSLAELNTVEPDLDDEQKLHTIPGITANKIRRARSIAVEFPALAKAVTAGKLRLRDADNIAKAASQDDDLRERLVSSPGDFDFNDLAEKHKDAWTRPKRQEAKLPLEGPDAYTYFDLVYDEEGEVIGEAYVRELVDSLDVDTLLDEIGQAVELSTDVKVIKEHLKTMSERQVEGLFISFFPDGDRDSKLAKKRNDVSKKVSEWFSSSPEGDEEEEEEAGSDD